MKSKTYELGDAVCWVPKFKTRATSKFEKNAFYGIVTETYKGSCSVGYPDEVYVSFINESFGKWILIEELQKLTGNQIE
jgi:hypothetical protein